RVAEHEASVLNDEDAEGKALDERPVLFLGLLELDAQRFFPGEVPDLEEKPFASAREIVKPADLQLRPERLRAPAAEPRPLRERPLPQRAPRELRSDALEVLRVVEERFEPLADGLPGLPPEERLRGRARIAHVPARVRQQDHR